jgi:hypothetical protein
MGTIMDNQQAMPPTVSRPGLETAKIVNAGIALQQTHGSAYAAEYLKKNGVRFGVIVRALSEPHRRRRSNDVVTPINAAR